MLNTLSFFKINKFKTLSGRKNNTFRQDNKFSLKKFVESRTHFDILFSQLHHCLMKNYLLLHQFINQLNLLIPIIMKVTRYLLAITLLAILMTGCEKSNSGSKGETGEYFDFATTEKCTLNVDYNLQVAGYTSGILFEVYAEDPYKISNDGSIVSRSDAKPVYKGMTSRQGHFEGTMQLASWVKKVWIYTDYPGVPNSVEAAVSAGGVSVNMAVTAKSQSLKFAANHEYPSNFYPIDGLDDWDSYGVPSYLNPSGAPKTVPAGLLSDIRTVLPEAKSLYDGTHSYLLKPNVNHNIDIIFTTTLDMVFLNDGAALNNVTGYYVYPTNNPPTDPAQITRRYIAFPNSSALNSYGKLVPGDYVHLKYINEDGDWTDQFEEGMSVGFFLFAGAFDGAEGWGNTGSGTIREEHPTNRKIYFSDPKLNYFYWHTDPAWETWQKQQVVALYDYASGRDLVVLGFEDMSNGGLNPSGDKDFNDVVFYLQATPPEGINVPGDRDDDLNPDPTPDPEEYVIEYAGTLAFEDLWPNKGDYDMNDVGIEYYSQIVRDNNNMVIKVIDQFTPVKKGASFENGFGYQYGVPVSTVKSMDWSVTPEKTRPNTYNYDAKGLEEGQTLATVMLFDNGKLEVEGPDLDYIGGQQSPIYTYTITTEFETPQSIDDVGFPPYNPFIVVKHASEGQTVNPRNREVHLPYYVPTDLARDTDEGWFGQYDDKSDKDEIWYVSDANFPFAINIPIADFEFPLEEIRIDNVYPRFSSWASSFGAQNADWYLHKNR